MLNLGYFTKFPAVYKDREATVKLVTFENVNYENTKDGNILIKSNTEKYNQEILLVLDENNKSISLRTPCTVYCSCESFKYEFANSLFKNNSLINPINMIRSIISRPKKKNMHNIPSGCKHIIALSKQIIKLNHKIIRNKE